MGNMGRMSLYTQGAENICRDADLRETAVVRSVARRGETASARRKGRGNVFNQLCLPAPLSGALCAKVSMNGQRRTWPLVMSISELSGPGEPLLCSALVQKPEKTVLCRGKKVFSKSLKARANNTEW